MVNQKNYLPDTTEGIKFEITENCNSTNVCRSFYATIDTRKPEAEKLEQPETKELLVDKRKILNEEPTEKTELTNYQNVKNI